jgi:hypothetical protein
MFDLMALQAEGLLVVAGHTGRFSTRLDRQGMLIGTPIRTVGWRYLAVTDFAKILGF